MSSLLLLYLFVYYIIITIIYSHLFIRVLFGDQIVKADALSTPEGHSAVIGDANAIKAQQDVPFLEGLTDWGSWLHPPYQNALLVSLSHQTSQVDVAASPHDCMIYASGQPATLQTSRCSFCKSPWLCDLLALASKYTTYHHTHQVAVAASLHGCVTGKQAHDISSHISSRCCCKSLHHCVIHASSTGKQANDRCTLTPLSVHIWLQHESQEFLSKLQPQKLPALLFAKQQLPTHVGTLTRDGSRPHLSLSLKGEGISIALSRYRST